MSVFSMRLFCVHVFIFLLIRNYCVSQFHQDDYDILHDRIDLIKVNKTATPTLILKVFYYNDTLKVKAINLTVNFRAGANKNILVTFAVYKNVQKTYRQFPFPNVTLDICEEFKKLGERNPFGIQSGIAKSNFKGCPVIPGIYYIDSWLLEQDKFPPHIPAGQYKLAIQAVADNAIFIFDAEYYGSIVKKKNKMH